MGDESMRLVFALLAGSVLFMMLVVVGLAWKASCINLGSQVTQQNPLRQFSPTICRSSVMAKKVRAVDISGETVYVPIHVRSLP